MRAYRRLRDVERGTHGDLPNTKLDFIEIVSKPLTMKLGKSKTGEIVMLKRQRKSIKDDLEENVWRALLRTVLVDDGRNLSFYL